MDKFRWGRDVEVVPSQLRTAAYLDGDGDLVVRQMRPTYGEDHVVVISRSNIPAFVARLTEIAAVPQRPPMPVQPNARGPKRPRDSQLKLVPPSDQ